MPAQRDRVRLADVRQAVSHQQHAHPRQAGGRGCVGARQPAAFKIRRRSGLQHGEQAAQFGERLRCGGPRRQHDLHCCVVGDQGDGVARAQQAQATNRGFAREIELGALHRPTAVEHKRETERESFGLRGARRFEQ